MTELARKFNNPTAGYVGANKFGPDGRPTAVAVPPGHDVWLTPAEERLTAEAPRHASNNPFTKVWKKPIAWEADGEACEWEDTIGTLVMSDSEPRPIASERFTPAQAEELAAAGHGIPTERPEPPAQPPAQPEADPATEVVANVEAENPQPPAEVPAEAPATEPEAPAEVTGAPPIPTQPPVEGAPAEHEIVATPDAVARNDEFLAAQAAGGPAPAPVQTPPLPVPVGPGGAS